MVELPAPGTCHICGGKLTIERVACADCGCAVEGSFAPPRLARLSAEEQQFVEMFVMLSGNLKKVAASLGVSYPTVRNRLDSVIASLQSLSNEDREKRERLIDSVEKGDIPASLAARLIEGG